jgi:hypothetical protein
MSIYTLSAYHSQVEKDRSEFKHNLAILVLQVSKISTKIRHNFNGFDTDVIVIYE